MCHYKTDQISKLHARITDVSELICFFLDNTLDLYETI